MAVRRCQTCSNDYVVGTEHVCPPLTTKVPDLPVVSIVCLCDDPSGGHSNMCSARNGYATTGYYCPTCKLSYTLDAAYKCPHRPSGAAAAEKGPMEDEIRAECAALADFLVSQNRKYGNSAFEPVRLFSKANAIEQLNVRIDDKLSRMVRGNALDDGEDTELDLVGYLVIRRIAQRKAAAPRG